MTVNAIGECLGLLASVVKSGEPWTASCQERYDAAMTELRQLKSSANGGAYMALQRYEQVFDALFADALSNGLYNAWHGLLDCTLLNQAHELATQVQPVPMVLHCPQCHMQHIDDEEHASARSYVDGGPLGMIETTSIDGAVVWDNPPHRSHLCHACGCVWRPADVATTGVESISTKGSADTWDPRVEVLVWPMVDFCPQCFASTVDGSCQHTVVGGHCTNCGSHTTVKLPQWAIDSIRSQASWIGKRYYRIDEDDKITAERKVLMQHVQTFPLRTARVIEKGLWMVEQRYTDSDIVSSQTVRAMNALEAMRNCALYVQSDEVAP